LASSIFAVAVAVVAPEDRIDLQVSNSKYFLEINMGTSASVFQGTGFCEFICDCGEHLGDSVHGSITHVLQEHCGFEQRANVDLLRDRVVSKISPNPLDFISEDLDS
jgi:hypothetical protein